MHDQCRQGLAQGADERHCAVSSISPQWHMAIEMLAIGNRRREFYWWLYVDSQHCERGSPGAYLGSLTPMEQDYSGGGT